MNKVRKKWYLMSFIFQLLNDTCRFVWNNCNQTRNQMKIPGINCYNGRSGKYMIFQSWSRQSWLFLIPQGLHNIRVNSSNKIIVNILHTVCTHKIPEKFCQQWNKYGMKSTCMIYGVAILLIACAFHVPMEKCIHSLKCIWTFIIFIVYPLYECSS